MEEWNQKMFSKPTQILDGDTREILGRYSSLREACRAFQGNYRTFKRTVKSGKKYVALIFTWNILHSRNLVKKTLFFHRMCNLHRETFKFPLFK